MNNTVLPTPRLSVTESVRCNTSSRLRCYPVLPLKLRKSKSDTLSDTFCPILRLNYAITILLKNNTSRYTYNFYKSFPVIKMHNPLESHLVRLMITVSLAPIPISFRYFVGHTAKLLPFLIIALLSLSNSTKLIFFFFFILSCTLYFYIEK